MYMPYTYVILFSCFLTGCTGFLNAGLSQPLACAGGKARGVKPDATGPVLCDVERNMKAKPMKKMESASKAKGKQTTTTTATAAATTTTRR